MHEPVATLLRPAAWRSGEQHDCLQLRNYFRNMSRLLLTAPIGGAHTLPTLMERPHRLDDERAEDCQMGQDDATPTIFRSHGGDHPFQVIGARHTQAIPGPWTHGCLVSSPPKYQCPHDTVRCDHCDEVVDPDFWGQPPLRVHDPEAGVGRLLCQHVEDLVRYMQSGHRFNHCTIAPAEVRCNVCNVTYHGLDLNLKD